MHSNRSGADYWRATLGRIADPVFDALSRQSLRLEMPVESNGAGRSVYSHLEAVGRLLSGMAPWLASQDPDAEPYRRHALNAVAEITNPTSPDRCNFTDGDQPLVDAAFLSLAILRAPIFFRDRLPTVALGRLIDALRSTRVIVPHYNNWLLFSATVEAALHRLGVLHDEMRVDYALRTLESWHLGDGVYSDGPEFHFDYYNSFVIHPMLIAILEELKAEGRDGPLRQLQFEAEKRRAIRYAVLLERMIHADGSFPAVGRSITYRCGAFHLLADVALRGVLPAELSPASVRCALAAVIGRTLDGAAPRDPGGRSRTPRDRTHTIAGPESGSAFDERGWLRIGLAGSQPSLGERYISTGSLYLCSNVFLPLGLPEEDPFWSAPDEPWSHLRIWGGEDVLADHAL